MENNKTLMQYFEWYIKPEDRLWKKVGANANFLNAIGITDIWLPPAYKACGGKYDAGYGVYDLYDLGEFDQKGSVETKYGTKDEYLAAIQELHTNNIKVYADIVLNHKMGADDVEEVFAKQVDFENREAENEKLEKISAWTKYNFPGRNNKYSDFKWNYSHFNGTDWDEEKKRNALFRFCGRKWAEDVDLENVNYDYLMGADIDFDNPEVIRELKKWGHWYLELTGVDGIRLDAIKHIASGFMAEWVSEMKENKNLKVVGEYWNGDINVLKKYINETNELIPLFDVPLHYNLYAASNSSGEYDMSKIFDNTLVRELPELAVTFVDNHDTEPGQALMSWVQDWFKPLAYAIILLRKEGLPCVFYGDYYGVREKDIESMGDSLEKLIKARKYFAYGEQIDFLDDCNIIGWARLGDEEHIDSGLVTILSDSVGGSKYIDMGIRFANTTFYDYTGNIKDTITLDENGKGSFYCDGGSVSVWVKQGNLYS